MNKKIGFIYYTFYPVRGGASVHGYNLARELKKLGYDLYKLNGEPDPWTTKLSGSLSGLLWILKNCDVIYVRMDHFITQPRNLIGLISLLIGKKVIVELNNPSDELYLFGRGKRYIRFVDRLYRLFLSRARAVIVVSEPLKTYCKQVLGLQRTYVIENGGEIFDPDSINPSEEIRLKMETIRHRFDSVVVWAGSMNEMQELEWVREFAREAGSDMAVLFIVNDEGGNHRQSGSPEEDNIFIFRNPGRQDVKFLILSADAGLAFYKPYPWSRWGYYNSSLKIYEYLNNGLLTFTNIRGTDSQLHSSFFRNVDSPEQAVEQIRNRRHMKFSAAVGTRTWDQVAQETARVIEEVIEK
ncbi:MAG: glycosyltransferase [Balneolaceae bacterium]